MIHPDTKLHFISEEIGSGVFATAPILKGTIVPEDPTRSVKKFFTTRHLSLIVAGPGSTALFGGGGDHGGPITKKIELPKNWDTLVAKYKDSRVPF